MTEFTTIERLAFEASLSYDAIVRYRGFVCLATLIYKVACDAESYVFIDGTNDGFPEIECCLGLNEKATEVFPNSGEAIKWCFDKMD